MFFLYSDPACLCDGKYFLQHGAIESARLRNRTPDADWRAGDSADAAERRDKHKLVPEGNADIARYLCLHAGRLKRAQQSARTLGSRIVQFSKSDKRLRLGGVGGIGGGPATKLMTPHRPLRACSAPSSAAMISGASTPFCMGRTQVSRPMRGRTARAASRTCQALTPRRTQSTSPISFGSSVAF